MSERPVVRRCPVCGSTELIPDLELGAFGGAAARHAVVYFEHPERTYFRGAIASPVKVTLCADCGYVLLFAQEYRGDIRYAYRKQQREKGAG